MTLILGGVNRHYAFLVSDRRVSWPGKQPHDEFNKAIALSCADARATISYTGLATLGSHDSSGWFYRADQWLPTAFYESGPPDFALRGILERVAAKATGKFAQMAAHQQLAIIVAGFEYEHQTSRPCLYTVHNHTKGGGSGEFIVVPARDEADIYLTSAGAMKALSDEGLSSLADLIRSHSPAPVVLDRAVGEIRRCAASEPWSKVIGKQCTSVVVRRDPSLPFEGRYHTSRMSDTRFLPALVWARPDAQLVAHTISARTPADPAIPRTARNARCPCGSGKKFKRCHGR